MIDIDSIEARAAAATPGPWTWSGQRPSNEPGVLPYVPQCSYIGETMICMGDTYENGREDAAFIASARENVPALCARVRELEAIAAAWEERAGAAEALASYAPGIEDLHPNDVRPFQRARANLEASGAALRALGVEP